MRRLLYFVVVTGVAAATIVALASASRTATSKVSASPGAESANAYLPSGETPAAANWDWTGGDPADTGFSQLKDINSTNVGSLKVVWNGSYSDPSVSLGSLQHAADLLPGQPDVPARAHRDGRDQSR